MELYFIAIVLPPDLNTEILLYKQWMLEKFGCKVALRSPAHITLLPPFRMAVDKESHLIQELDLWAFDKASFTLKTNHFASFGKRTLFIEPVVTPELKELNKSLDDFGKRHSEYGIKVDHRPFHPHITIANRDMTPEAFDEAWAYFKEQTFQRHWTANEIGTLRLKKNWEVIHTSQFQNL